MFESTNNENKGKTMSTTTQKRDSTVYPVRRQGFTPTNDAIVYRQPGSPPMIRRVYQVDDFAIDWDIPGFRPTVSPGERLLAIGNRFGFVTYVVIRTTGRTETKAPNGWYGWRCRVWANLGPEHEGDTEARAPFGAHYVQDYWSDCKPVA